MPTFYAERISDAMTIRLIELALLIFSLGESLSRKASNCESGLWLHSYLEV